MKLFYFLLGFITCQYILPILDSLSGILFRYLELQKGKIIYQITKMKKEVEKIDKPNSILGFGITDPDFTKEDDET